MQDVIDRNGVGAERMELFVNKLEERTGLKVVIRNKVLPAGKGLNEGCGAEHVQKKRLPPAGFTAESDGAFARCAAFDGDADRIVYFFFDDKKQFTLLDGDKIAALAAAFVNKCLDDANMRDDISVGVVQTAYANGAATRYIRETLGMEAPYVKTGVKYLHHKALEYDIGIYFEANGHGTVIFKDAMLDKVRSKMVTGSGKQLEGMKRLLAASQLLNQAVGDAITDMLFVEALLANGPNYDGSGAWDVKRWNGMYEDLPSRQTKVKVADRTKVITVPDETRLVEPMQLQNKIDSLVASREKGRAFVRPSGTEDVVRVYAEAATQKLADALAVEIAQAVYDHAGGRGDRPTTESILG